MIKKITAILSAACITVCSASCGKDKDSEKNKKLAPPPPVECDDPNAVTFDNDDFSFVSVINDDSQSANGNLSITDLEGNKMLMFTDDLSVPLESKVQKLSVKRPGFDSP